MMASRMTLAAEEEGAEVEGAEEEGGIVEAAGSSISTHGRFGQSWALLRQIEPVLMAPMVVKKGEEGMGMSKCVRIHMIAGNMSLSHVAIAKYISRIDVMK